jgi:hypothetical protein
MPENPTIIASPKGTGDDFDVKHYLELEHEKVPSGNRGSRSM